MVGVPGVAFAHGVSRAGESVSDFVWSGFTHMLAGWDHLLFIAGIVLIAGTVRRSAKLISVFAVGHSTTLILATLAGWRLNATFVDIVIAQSLVFVGVVGLAGRRQRWRWFAAAVFGFGLVHGLGLSTRLQDLGLPHDGLLARVIAFNIGVEIGQLLAVVGMFMLGDVLRHYIDLPRTSRFALAGLVVAGLVAGVVLATSMARVAGDGEPAQASTVDSCQVLTPMEIDSGQGAHLRKDFLESNPDGLVEGLRACSGR